MLRLPPLATLLPYTTLFRSVRQAVRLTGREKRYYVRMLEAGGELYLSPESVDADRRRHFRREHLNNDFAAERSEEHTSELQSPCKLVCRLLLEKHTAALPLA